MTSEADIKEEVTETTSQAEDKIEKPNEGTSDEKGESSEAKKGTVKEDGDKEVKLYVGNLPDNCKRSSLQEQFEKYGKVSQCDIVKNFAFVHMVGEKSAKDAVDNLDDTEFCGTHIQVQYAKSKGKPAEDECFQCGRHGHWAKDCPKRRRYDDYRRDRYDYRGYDYGPPRRGPYDRPPPRGGYYDPYMDRRPAPPGRDYYSYGSYSYRSRSPNMERRSPPRYTGNYEGYPAPRDGYGTRRY